MRYALQNVYIVWILVSTVGLLQALASYYRWDGLSFFRGHRWLGYACAALLIPASYYWFFSLKNRNVPGLEGWQLFSRFAVGAWGGVVVVLVLSSLINASMSRRKSGEPAPAAHPGLDDLRHGTYFHLLSQAVATFVGKGER